MADPIIPVSAQGNSQLRYTLILFGAATAIRFAMAAFVFTALRALTYVVFERGDAAKV